MMATRSDFNASENIACFHFMEKEVLALAKRKKFSGILTTNTSPLCQQLGSYVYGYKTLREYSINKYVHHDGSKPFQKAPDSLTLMVQYKDIRNYK